MKRSLFMLAAITAVLAACAKEEILPKTAQHSSTPPESIEKEMGNTKIWTQCWIYVDNKPKYEGYICKGEGNQCGRKSVCSLANGKFEEPDEVVFMDLTRQQFADLWSTEEGMEYLLSKGVYVVEAD
jgi:hypothetical protein